MNPWEVLGSAKVPGGSETLTLHRRGDEYLIKVDGHLLMDNRAHASEDALAELGCRKAGALRKPRVLVGGLGMGFTLAAALRRLGAGAKVDVSELVPEVVEWNRGPISHLAGRPLQDPRVEVHPRDIALILRERRDAYDAILQDVDNGPEGQTLKANDWLYSDAGLAAAASALRPAGVIAFWSSKPNRDFVKRLRKADFEVAEYPVRSRGGRGTHYVVWTATKR
ncbi:MAG: hypothetical protein HY078_10350 [Elusimicrobia bacterium]|nr:hypothetical protein [Elusimicrobiota bacterium]